MAKKTKKDSQFDVARTQETRMLRSTKVLNVSDKVVSSPNTAAAVVQDSYEDVYDVRHEQSTPTTQSEESDDLDAYSETRHAPPKTKVDKEVPKRNQDIKTAQTKKRDHSQVDKAATRAAPDGKLRSTQSVLSALKYRIDPRNEEAVAEATKQTNTEDDSLADAILSISALPSSEGHDSGGENTERRRKKQKVAQHQESRISQPKNAKSSRVPGKGVERPPKTATRCKITKRDTQAKRRTDNAHVPAAAVSVTDQSHATPTSAQQPMLEQHPVAQDSVSHHLSWPPAYVRKHNAGTIPLVDESVSKKTSIIAFGSQGPRNQGRRLEASSATKPSNEPHESSRHVSEVPTESPTHVDQQESMVAHTQRKDGQSKKSSVLSNTDDPLAGYAKFVAHKSQGDKQAQSLKDQTRYSECTHDETAPEGNAGQEQYKQVASQAESPGQHAMEELPPVRTASQLAMPPPKMKLQSNGVKNANTAPTTQMQSAQVVELVASSPPLEVDDLDDDPSSATDEVTCQQKDIEVSKSDVMPPAQSTTEHSELQPETKRNYSHAIDDSGYKSMQTVPMYRSRPPRKTSKHQHKYKIDKCGSPQLEDQHEEQPKPEEVVASEPPEPVEAIVEATGTDAQFVSHFAAPQIDLTQRNPFLQHAINTEPTTKGVFHLHRLRAPGEEAQSAAKPVAAEGNTDNDHETTQQDQYTSPHEDIEAHMASVQPLQSIEEMLAWRDDLPQHHASLFDLLLSDAHAMVAQIVRREELVQERVEAFRKNGWDLVRLLESLHNHAHESLHAE